MEKVGQPNQSIIKRKETSISCTLAAMDVGSMVVLTSTGAEITVEEAEAGAEGKKRGLTGIEAVVLSSLWRGCADDEETDGEASVGTRVNAAGSA
jgi:hypothetical protein